MTHLIKWDLRIRRNLEPWHLLDGGRVPRPPSPVAVEVSAEFDTDEAAQEFERRVRELLDQS
jgi:hypothetical protein